MSSNSASGIINVERESAFRGSYKRVAEVTSSYAEWRYWWLLFALLLLMYLGNVCYLSLEQGEEVIIAGVARTMLESGDYFVPRLNGRIFLEYPPLYYYLECLSFRWFGFTAFAAKLPSILAAVVGAHMLYYLLRAMKTSPFTAFLSSLILATSVQYFSCGLYNCVDTLLVLFCIMSWLGFYSWSVKEQKRKRLLFFTLLVAGLAGCSLTRNWQGMLIPLSGIIFYMAADDLIQRNFRLERYIMVFFAALLALIPYFCYCRFLYTEFGWETLLELLRQNNYDRLMLSGREPEYLYDAGGLFQPWLIFLFIAVVFHLRRVVRKHAVNSLYSLCILFVPLVWLSYAAGGQHIFLLPLYAPAAILTGVMFGMFAEGKIVKFTNNMNDFIIKVSFYIIFGLGLIAPVAFIIAGVCLGLPGWGRYWAAVLMFILTLRVLSLVKPRHEERLLWYLAVIFALIYPNISGIVLAERSVGNTLDGMFAGLESKPGRIYLYSPDETLAGAAAFYLGQERIAETGAEGMVHPGDIVIAPLRYMNPVRWDVREYLNKYMVAERLGEKEIAE